MVRLVSVLRCKRTGRSHSAPYPYLMVLEKSSSTISRTRDTKPGSRFHVTPVWSIASSDAIRPSVVAGKLNLSSLAIDTPSNRDGTLMRGIISKNTLYGLALLCALMPYTARAADPIGQVKAADGPVTVERGGASQPVAVGDHVFQSDVVVTAAGGSVGITFI